MSVNEVKRAPPPPDLQILGETPSQYNPAVCSGKTYAIGSEDHTLGNALRHILVRGLSGGVSFAGYSVPHPSEEIVHLRVQVYETNKEGSEGVVCGCDEMVIEGCKALGGVCDILRAEVLKKTRLNWEGGKKGGGIKIE